MKNSETGEYELVVGNGQLLSAFFIVALLLGVAFGLGYMIGQNAQRSKPPADTAASAAPNVVTQAPAQPAASPAPVEPAAEQPSQAAADSAAQPSPAAPQPTTQPVRETPVAAAPAPAPAAAAESQVPAGSYWQVVAYRSSDEALPMVRTLQDGGMPVIARTLPDGLVHVLVGPYSEPRALSSAKETLTKRFGTKPPLLKKFPVK